jgi:hypothetical protein
MAAEADEKARLRYPAPVVAAIAIVAIVVTAFVVILARNPGRAGTLTLFHDDKKIATIDIKEGNVALDRLLGDLFRDEERERPFRALVRELRQYYQLRDPALVPAIATLDYGEPIAKGIRQLYVDGRGPFVPQELDVRIELASDNRIRSGHAAVCASSDLFRKEWLVLGPDGRGAAVILADLQGRCSASGPNAGDPPLVQINFTDARRIFGCTAFAKQERAYAIEKRFETPDAVRDPDCERKGRS